MTRMDFRDLIVAELGEPFAYSYFDRSNFANGILSAWSGTAHDRWRMLGSAFMRRHGVVLGERMPIDAWRVQMAAE